MVVKLTSGGNVLLKAGVVACSCCGCSCSIDITTLDCVFDPGVFEFTPFTMYGALPTSATDYGVKFIGSGSHTVGSFDIELEWLSTGRWRVNWTVNSTSDIATPEFYGGRAPYEDHCQPNPEYGTLDESAWGGGSSVSGWRGFYDWSDGGNYLAITVKGDHSVCM